MTTTQTDRQLSTKHRHHTGVDTLTICVSVMVLLLAMAAQPASAADKALLDVLHQQKVMPQILVEDSDLDIVKLSLDGKALKAGVQVAAGNFKKIDFLKTEWYVNNNDAQHTLVLLDLDKKQRLNGTSGGNHLDGFYNLYTSINIPGHDVARGQAIVSIEPPTVPCMPQSRHRILMLAYHQSQTIDFTDIINIAASPGQSSKRENFNLANFANRLRLRLISANLFLAVGEQNGVCSGASSSFNWRTDSIVVWATILTASMFQLINYSSRDRVPVM